MFIGIKGLAAWSILKTGGLTLENVQLFTNAIFDDATTAIFGTLVGYWFGSRSMTKMWELTDPTASSYKITDVSVRPKKR
jgi:hypothetical protein